MKKKTIKIYYCAPSSIFSIISLGELENTSGFGMQLCFGARIGTEGLGLQLSRGARGLNFGFLHSSVTVTDDITN